MPRFTTSDGLTLAYEDDGGPGVPLLCLAGLTRDARDFDDLAAVAPPGLRLIRLTSRGRGASDWAPDPQLYSIPVEARDALELLDHLKLDAVVILGTSRGGLIAMVIAATQPQRLLGTILNDIGPVLEPEGLERIKDYIGIAPKARDFDELARALKASMGAGFPTLSDASWHALAQRWFREDDDGIGLTYDPKLRDAVLAAGAQPAPDLWPLFDALAAKPLATIRGANSDLLSAAVLAQMQARAPQMIAATVPDRGHVPFLDEPEALAAIEALVARIEP